MSVGVANNYNAKEAVVMSFDACNGGLSHDEAMAVGAANNFEHKEAWRMDFNTTKEASAPSKNPFSSSQPIVSSSRSSLTTAEYLAQKRAQACASNGGKKATKEKKRVPPAPLKEILRRCKAKGMSDAYFFRSMDSDGGNSVTKGEFETGLALVRLQLQPSEINMIFNFFDQDGNGKVDYGEFSEVLSDKAALTQPRWNASPAARYRQEEEKAADVRANYDEVQELLAASKTASPRRMRAPQSATAAFTIGELGPTWMPQDVGLVAMEQKEVPMRLPRESSVLAHWEAQLRTTSAEGHPNDHDACFMTTMRSKKPGVDISSFGEIPLSTAYEIPIDAQAAHIQAPARPRNPAAPVADAVMTAALEDLAQEVFDPDLVPQAKGRIKSAAEIIKAKQAHRFIRAAERELKEFNAESNMYNRGIQLDRDGDGRVEFAEWQRASNKGLAAGKGNHANLPPEVQLVLKRMKDNGFADCYFFRMIDKDGNGQVTKGEFEQGLQLLKMDLDKEDFEQLYRHFDKDDSGRIDYLELQKALGTEDGTASNAQKRFSFVGPRTPFAGPPQFSEMAVSGNAYPLLGCPEDMDEYEHYA